MKYTFQPDIKTIGQIDGVLNTESFKYEPMIFSGDLAFTKEVNGPITSRCLKLIEESDEFQKCYQRNSNVVVDTRVTMTMKGAYPSIPGWHCDDVPRSEKYSQPTLYDTSDKIQHFMVLLADVEAQSCTEFVSEPFSAEIDETNVWFSLHNEVIKHAPNTRFIKQGEIIRFNQTAIHRASAAKNPGWRFFMRVSLTHRKPANEIRRQVQVYIDSNGGW